MFLRRSALRLISSPSTVAFSQPRNYSRLATSPFRTSRQSTIVQFQRRWATDDAAKEKEQVPISELQATPQEEVENAIHTDNAAASTGQSTTTNASAQQSSKETTEEKSTVQAATETVSGAVSQVASAIQDVAGRANPLRSYGEVRKTHAELVRSPKKTVYVGNLFFDVTENDLVKELTRFGPIAKAKLLRDARGLSKGFGYVEFESIDAATKAIEGLNQQLFEGRRLTVQYAAYDSSEAEKVPQRQPFGSGPRNPPSKTLFIGNMSFEMTDRDLNNLFRGIRNVIDVRVAIDRRTGQPRGFAHADFIDVKSAVEAQKQLEGKEIYGRKLKIDFSFGPSNAPKNVPVEG